MVKRINESMFDDPSIIEPSSQDYRKLVAVAAILEAISSNNTRYEVRDVYFDYGQDWKWTTICSPSCQILSPRQWGMIINSVTASDLAKAVNDITSGEYFRDR